MAQTTTTVIPPTYVLYKHPVMIAMSGLIGVGKTTLSDSLGTELGYKVYHELDKENGDLTEFYADMHENAFWLQIELLTRRLELHQSIVYDGKNSIVDRSIYEDAVFAHVLHLMGHISLKQYNVYLNLTRVMHNGIRRPTVIIHLDISPEKALERIQRRGRKNEQGITLEYLQKLHEAYQIFLEQLSAEVPVLRFCWDEFESTEKVAKAIVHELKTLRIMRNVELV